MLAENMAEHVAKVQLVEDSLWLQQTDGGAQMDGTVQMMIEKIPLSRLLYEEPSE